MEIGCNQFRILEQGPRVAEEAPCPCTPTFSSLVFQGAAPVANGALGGRGEADVRKADARVRAGASRGRLARDFGRESARSPLAKRELTAVPCSMVEILPSTGRPSLKPPASAAQQTSTRRLANKSRNNAPSTPPKRGIHTAPKAGSHSSFSREHLAESFTLAP